MVEGRKVWQANEHILNISLFQVLPYLYIPSTFLISYIFPFVPFTHSTSGIEYANFPKRDLIFCLTSVESYLDLSAQDLEFGFNETRRDRILRTFVRNNFHYHLNEIFAVLKVRTMNEKLIS